MLEEIRDKYEGRKLYHADIEEIQWYTRDTFFFRLINTALRALGNMAIFDTHLLWYTGQFIIFIESSRDNRIGSLSSFVIGDASSVHNK